MNIANASGYDKFTASQGKYDDAAADAYDAIGLGNTWTAEVLDAVYPKAEI